MKTSKEYKISIVLSIVALALFIISFITGLIPELKFAVNKTCMYLGFSFLFLGVVFLKKAKDNNDESDAEN